MDLDRSDSNHADIIRYLVETPFGELFAEDIPYRALVPEPHMEKWNELFVALSFTKEEPIKIFPKLAEAELSGELKSSEIDWFFQAYYGRYPEKYMQLYLDYLDE